MLIVEVQVIVEIQDVDGWGTRQLGLTHLPRKGDRVYFGKLPVKVVDHLRWHLDEDVPRVVIVLRTE